MSPHRVAGPYGVLEEARQGRWRELGHFSGEPVKRAADGSLTWEASCSGFPWLPALGVETADAGPLCTTTLSEREFFSAFVPYTDPIQEALNKQEPAFHLLPPVALNRPISMQINNVQNPNPQTTLFVVPNRNDPPFLQVCLGYIRPKILPVLRLA